MRIKENPADTSRPFSQRTPVNSCNIATGTKKADGRCVEGTNTGVFIGEACICPALTMLSASSYQRPAGNSLML